MNQRWNLGRDSYRPAGEPIRTSDYDVAAVPKKSIAKAFVEGHHYSGRMSVVKLPFGLYRKGTLVGVAAYGPGMNSKAITNVFPAGGMELTRFVLLDDVPANGETWFLARTFEELRRLEIPGVISFSDPVARTTSDGRKIFGGHIGTIYQAHNAVYLGRASRASLRILPDGTVFSKRAISKIRAQDMGHQYAERILEGFGADPVGDQDPTLWLTHWVQRLTRPLSHPGNHKYAWALHRGARRELPAPRPYPKQERKAS